MTFRLKQGMNYERVKMELEESMMAGKLAIVPRNVRQVGKTQALIEFAKTYDLIIIAPNKDMVDHIQLRAGQKGLAYTARSILRRPYLARNGVLIEEGVTLEDLDRLRDHKISIRGGFFVSDHF